MWSKLWWEIEKNKIIWHCVKYNVKKYIDRNKKQNKCSRIIKNHDMTGALNYMHLSTPDFEGSQLWQKITQNQYI